MAIEVVPTALESAQHVRARDVVPALPNPRGEFRPQRGEADGDHIGINEVNDTCLPGQELAGECGFPRAIRPGDDNAAEVPGVPGLHFSQKILISFCRGLNSGSPVMSSAFFSLARAAAK